MLKREISIRYVIIIALLSVMAGSIFSYIVSQHIATSEAPVSNNKELVASLAGCEYAFPRLNGFRYIRPLLFVDQNCESEKYKPMKEQIAQVVQKLTNDGILTSASVYVRDFDESAWICYNPEEKYDPASIMKLPILFSFLRLSEDYPNLLNQELTCKKSVTNMKVISFPSETIQPGRTYTYRQILQSMIVHSDNNATQLLMDNLDEKQFLKTFSDLDLEIPKRDSSAYQINAKDVSVFLKVLYDGSYLTMRNSDYATSLLAESDFKEGIVKGLPANVKVAHKFGESGDGNLFGLHETAIVYFGKSPYLITIMTKGKDIKKLPEAVSTISGLVYNNMVHYN